MREQSLEMAVHHVEGGKQALAAFAVQALDRLAQLADRLDDVLAFRDDRFQPLGKLPLLLLGAQIDRTQPLALDLQPVEPLFHIGHVGQRRVGVQFRLADRQMRRRVQHLLDARFGLATALVGGVQPLLGAGASLAGLGQRGDRCGRGLVQRGLPGLGLLQAVGGSLAQRFGLGELAEQRAPPGVDLVGRIGQRFQFGRGLATALAERSDLRFGVRRTLHPGAAVGRDGAEAAHPRFRLALQPLMEGARIGQHAAIAGDGGGKRLRAAR